MLRIRTTGPLILASLLKQPHCHAFPLLTAVGSRLTRTDFRAQGYRTDSTASGGWSTMPPEGAKRGHWQRKKEQRSRSFAKRGRVGGWGDYGPNGPRKREVVNQAGGATSGETSLAEEATATGENAAGHGSHRNGNAKPSGNRRKQQTRKVETVHAGSYAGELGATLSEERSKMLKDRLEQDKKAAQAKEQEKNDAADTPADGATSEVPPASPGEGSDGEEGVASSSSKKKVALLISYWGSNYRGLQINEGAKTVEAELELALYLAGGISMDNFGNPRKVSWSRAGRTDKGVHAVAQVISMKLVYPNDGEEAMVEAINRYLPNDIRAVDIKRAPKSFDSRMRCTGRRYEYVMPTYVLAPKEHVAALFQEALEWEQSHGGGESSIACTAEGTPSVTGGSTQGNLAQPAGIAGGGSGAALQDDASIQPEAAATVKDSVGISTVSDVSVDAVGEEQVQDRSKGGGLVDAEVEGGELGDGSDGDGDDDADSNQDEEEDDEEKAERLRQAVELSSPAVIRRVAERLEGYRLPTDRVEELRETLKGFVGTKNYHNYTNHKKATDPSCKRLITSFEAADPFENDGMEWVRLTVGGQSFMLHQIRKMVASSVDRVRGQSSLEDWKKSFFPAKTRLGIAPSEGLYLERPLYDPYNAHAKRTGAHDRVLEWNSGPTAEALEDFKKNKIHAGILAKEKVDYDFVAWLDRITRYPCTY